MKKILVSACLLGDRVRYDGKISRNDLLIDQLKKHDFEIISFCPEVEAGLTVPREPSEIQGGNSESVLKGTSKILDIKGNNVTEYLLKGAELALKKTRLLNIKHGLLKDGCASCGSTYVFDGNFNGTAQKGKGMTALLLEKNEIQIFNENEIQELIDSCMSTR